MHMSRAASITQLASAPGHDGQPPARAAARSTAHPAATAGRKVNILQLTTGLNIGGAEIVVGDLARNLDRERFNVGVCCLRVLGSIGEQLADEGIDISVVPGVDLSKVDYLTALKLRRIVRDRKIDLVHTHTTHALVDAAICRVLSRSAKVVHTFHFGNYPHCSNRTLLMEGISSRLVDHLVAVGHVQREQIKKTFHLPDGAISVVRNGVHVPASLQPDQAWRRSVGAEGKVLVGTIVTLISQKGLHDWLSIARRVADVRKDVHFVLVGDGVLRGELEQRRRDLGLEDTVTLAGWVNNAAARTLPAFDIYFQPSLWEAMSISILEAMAAGKAVVSTDVGEAPRLIEHGVDGFLYKPRDIQGMASALLTLSQNPSLRTATGQAAARKVANQFTVAHMTRAHEDLYLRVLNGDNGSRAHAVR